MGRDVKGMLSLGYRPKNLPINLPQSVQASPVHSNILVVDGVLRSQTAKYCFPAPLKIYVMQFLEKQ